ncbi:MAG TPA: thiamine pyrophosphate-dependent dehydrogenase E1 component subunit alpha [Chthonomonadales bacterium]|nr:thiamine pyrophosphate-dependent dehydrogenase E1 component subunit alpha [Chthonomonadales bacterium]
MNGKTNTRVAVQEDRAREIPPARRDRELLYGLYYQLWRVRHFEESVARLNKQGKIIGGVYSGRGQEAIVVGTCYGLRRDDKIAPVHRDIGAFLVKGMPARSVMAQIMARETAPSRGKDSWTHTGDLEIGIIGSTSMLASSMPIAVGVGLACRMQGKDSVVVCYFGEGSTARGDFHEALNFAGIHKAPCVWICENNQYAYSTPNHLESPVPFFKKGEAYGMPSFAIDGNDVLEVYDKTMEAVARARRGEGGTFIECVTYRIEGHSEADQATYRSREEVEEWLQKDPILRLRNFMLANGFTEEELPEPPREVIEEVRDAIEYATHSPLPEGREAVEDIYDESAGVTHWARPYPNYVRIPWLGR